MNTKQCSSCKEAKPIEAFGRNRYGKDGKHYSCKECVNYKIACRRRNRIKPYKPNPSHSVARILTPDDVRLIRAMPLKPTRARLSMTERINRVYVTMHELAEKFEVSVNCIANVVNYQTYRDVR